MITLIILLAWFVGGLATFRRVGYALEATAQRGHEFQSICRPCRCKHCGLTPNLHRLSFEPPYAHAFEFKDHYIPHSRTLLAFLPTMVAWPVISVGYLMFNLAVVYGLAPGAFFVPPPAIESKAARQARLLADAETELAAANARLKELGVE